MRALWEILGKPALFAGLLVWAVFGTRRGTAVQDDYTWIIGVIVLVGGIFLQLRLRDLQDRLEACEKKRGP